MENERKPGLSESHRLKLRGVAITLGISVIFAFVFGLVLQSSTRVPGLVTTVVFGRPFGTVLVLLQLSGLNQIRFRSFLVTTLYRTLLHAAATGLAFFISLGINVAVVSRRDLANPEVWRIARETIVSSPVMIGSALGTVALIFMVGSVAAVSRKLGPGVMTNWVRG